jgi:hypothetical protein
MRTSLAILMAMSFCAASARASLLFYEGFDYAAGSDLQGLGTPLGGSGTWVDTSSHTMTVRANGTSVSQNWQGIPGSSTFTHTGGYLEGDRVDNNEGYIALAPSVTAQFTDGSVIWMSYIAAATTVTGQNDNHHKPNVAIGQGALLDDRAEKADGQAVGAGAASNTESLSATYWDDQTVPADGAYEEHRSTNTLSRIRPEQLVIAKFVFGATSDTVLMAGFALDPYDSPTEADFDAAAVSITSANNLDQATFDTLSFHGSRSNFDEIRLATTYDEVLSAVEVPEPASLLTGLVGLTLLAGRRR